MAPAVEMSPLQDAADGGGTELGGLGDAIGGMQLTPQGDDLFGQRRRGAARAAVRDATNDPTDRAVPGRENDAPTWRRFSE